MIAFLRNALGYTIPIRVLAFFFEAMCQQLRAGRAISEVLLHASTAGYDPELRQICADILPKVRQGESLCVCLRAYEQRFPEIVFPVLEVGELSGDLAAAARRLADTFGQTLSIERKFKVNVYDPRLCLLALCLLQTTHLIIQALASSATTQSPAALAVLIALQVVVLAIGLTVAFLMGHGLLWHLARWQALRLPLDTIKVALPRLGLVFRNLAAARWARSFATLWAAGVNISTALEVSARSALNAHYERALRTAAVQTRVGRSLSESLDRTQLLPAYLLGVIASSEETGHLDEHLLILAAEMEQEALARAVEEMNKVVVAAQIIGIIVAVTAQANGLVG